MARSRVISTLQNILAKVKAGLWLQLSAEIAKSIYSNATFVDAWNSIEILFSMVETAYGLPYKYEDFTVAINLDDAQLEQDLAQTPLAREQERFEMTGILNDERVEYNNGKKLDLEVLLNRIYIVFNPIEKKAPEDDSLQAALLAQVCRKGKLNIFS